MGPRQAGGVCSAIHGFTLCVVCQAAGRVLGGDQQPDCRRGTRPAVLEHLVVPCASSSVTLRGLSGTDQVAAAVRFVPPHHIQPRPGHEQHLPPASAPDPLQWSFLHHHLAVL